MPTPKALRTRQTLLTVARTIIWNWDVGAEFRISIKKPGLQGLRP